MAKGAGAHRLDHSARGRATGLVVNAQRHAIAVALVALPAAAERRDAYRAHRFAEHPLQIAADRGGMEAICHAATLLRAGALREIAGPKLELKAFHALELSRALDHFEGHERHALAAERLLHALVDLAKLDLGRIVGEGHGQQI